jgi:hypothetical protein
MNELLVGMRALPQVLPAILKKLDINFVLAESELRIVDPMRAGRAGVERRRSNAHDAVSRHGTVGREANGADRCEAAVLKRPITLTEAKDDDEDAEELATRRGA